MGGVVAASDVVVTTAAVPGKKAPVLITADMVRNMAPGSVIVDLAAERGGNCELTSPGQIVWENGVSIIGPTNLPATVPFHSSQMFAKNISTFLLSLIKDGQLAIDMEDEIHRETLVTRDGQIVNERVKQVFGI
jgi:H+-translocating NAD(P) transhydrogenase subunit alpha